MVSKIILKRIYAYLIDIIIISVPMYIFIFIFWNTFIKTHPKDLVVIALGIQFLPFLIYFFISEAFFGNTIGKKIMNLKVVTENNRFICVLIRTICRLIPLDLITFVFFKDRLLHDYLSKTKVIYK